MAEYKNSSEYAAAARYEAGARTGTAACRQDGDDVSAYLCPGVHGAAENEDGVAAVEPAAAYYNSGVVAGEEFPLVSKVLYDKKTSLPGVAVGEEGKGAGAFAECLRRGLPVIGISVASLAVAELAAGEPTPAAAFGLFLMLIAGLSVATIGAVRA